MIIKRHLLWSFVLAVYLSAKIYAQGIPANTEQQLEDISAAVDVETEDDSYQQQLDEFKKNPVNLNLADEVQLRELRLISDLQIQQLLSYRRLFGKFISIYELQAIPSWDLVTIRKLLPFVNVSYSIDSREDLGRRLRYGENSILIRVSQILERSKGYNESTGSKYLGSPQKAFFRYRYKYKNLLQWGLTGDKDAGEQFFKGAQKMGFDFYSIHFFMGKAGSVQALALGDFTVNMGQGLIQWQSLAFKKGSDIMGIKRQSPVLHPYNSAGEFNFYRGAGLTIRKRGLEATLFASWRELNANVVVDSVSNKRFVTSLLPAGYNRTAAEIADRKCLRQFSMGSNLKYDGNHLHLGLNNVWYKFSIPIRKQPDPYNYYAITGDQWHNFSVDYSYTFRNLHFFGEMAGDKNLDKAFLNGMLISVDPRVDLSLLYRNIASGYQAFNADAFTENADPTNERGIYSAMTIRPRADWRIDTYADLFSFPWIKFRVDGPSYGKDFFVQVSWTPNKKVEVVTRYRNENKQANQTIGADEPVPGPTNYLVPMSREDWRVQLNYVLNSSLSIRNREEILQYDRGSDSQERGFLAFFDLIYKPLLHPYSAGFRLQYLETDGYNSRLYAYENDVLYSYSIPPFYDKGFHYYLNVNYDFSKIFSLWFRWSQTIYRGKSSIGSALDEIDGNRRSELKLQLRVIL